MTRAARAGAAPPGAFRLLRGLGLWGPVIAQMAVIFAASSIPDLKTLPGGVPDWSAHGAAYAILGALLLRALAGGRREAVTIGLAAWAVVLATAYGVTDEWHQTFVHGRSASLADLGADAAGAALAVVVGWAWCAATRRRPGTGPGRRV